MQLKKTAGGVRGIKETRTQKLRDEPLPIT